MNFKILSPALRGQTTTIDANGAPDIVMLSGAVSRRTNGIRPCSKTISAFGTMWSRYQPVADLLGSNPTTMAPCFPA